MKILHKTLPLIVGLSIVGVDASYGSDDLGVAPRATTQQGNYTDLKAQNEKMKAELLKTQALLAEMLQRQDSLAIQISTVPGKIEEETAKRIVRAIFVDPPLPGGKKDGDGEDESGPPLNHQFLYVENLLAELAHAQKLSFQPFLETMEKAQYNALIHDLERRLGITQRRTEEEELKKRLEQRKRDEEELLRRQLEIESLKGQLKYAHIHLREAAGVQERQRNRISELMDQNEALQGEIDSRHDETISSAAVNYN